LFEYSTETSEGRFRDKVDILIILDACRHDYFVKHNQIKGELSELNLKATSTLDWLNLSWPNYYDITYVSANPNVNSVTGRYSRGYFGRQHFSEVVDVWNFGWSDELQTVHPHSVNEAAKKLLDRDLIIHYIQPHAPYIGDPRLNINTWKDLRSKILGHPISGSNPTTTFLANPDLNLLRQAYSGNLKLVLEAVRNLLELIPRDKEVAVTSDHSELLGEGGLIGHGYRQNREIPVPYLKVRET